MKKENVELQGKLNKLKMDYENANEQIKVKDEKIQQMSKEIQNLVSFRVCSGLWSGSIVHCILHQFVIYRIRKFLNLTKTCKTFPSCKKKLNCCWMDWTKSLKPFSMMLTLKISNFSNRFLMFIFRQWLLPQRGTH